MDKAKINEVASILREGRSLSAQYASGDPRIASLLRRIDAVLPDFGAVTPHSVSVRFVLSSTEDSDVPLTEDLARSLAAHITRYIVHNNVVEEALENELYSHDEFTGLTLAVTEGSTRVEVLPPATSP